MAAFTFSLPPSSTRALWRLSVVPSTGEAALQLALLHPATSHLPVEPPRRAQPWGHRVLRGFVPPGPEQSRRVCAGGAEELAALLCTPRQSTEQCRLPSPLARYVLDLAVSRVLLPPLGFAIRTRSVNRAAGQWLPPPWPALHPWLQSSWVGCR